MEENSMNEIVKLMHKIDKAMEMSKDKKANIDQINNDIMNETRPAMIEVMRSEIGIKEQDKKEFDEMTKNSLIKAKKDILGLKNSTEKEYQEKLIETAKRQRELEAKIKKINEVVRNQNSQDISDEKREKNKQLAENAILKTQNELETANSEMKKFQDMHFTRRNKLDEFDKNLEKYALELGFEKELANVSLEENKQEENKKLNDKNETPSKNSKAKNEKTKRTRAPRVKKAKTINPEKKTKPSVANKEEKIEPKEPIGPIEPKEPKEPKEPDKKQPVEEKNEKPIVKGTPIKVEPENIMPSEEPEKTDKSKYDHKKILSIEIKNGKYNALYENKKDGIYHKEMSVYSKVGLFKSLRDRMKLIINRSEYGIGLTTALKADINILNILNNEKLSTDYKEAYLKMLEGTGQLPFEIKYDKNNRYNRALQEGQKRLELNAAENIEEFAGVTPEEKHNRRQKALDEIFGEGFDQHEEPFVVDDKTTGKVQKEVRAILYGIDENGNKVDNVKADDSEQDR